MSERVEALVIGGGVAGAAAAIDLARAGRQVLLLEREPAAHHKVCGEFISPEGVRALQRLGVDPVALGGVPIASVRMLHGDRASEARLGFQAVSLSRFRLDDALLAEAQASGVEVRRGVKVVDLMGLRQGWHARTADGGDIRAGVGFLAVGKHDLKGWKRPPAAQNDLVGFKLHWRLTAEARAALEGRVELFLFPGGYGGLEPVEDGLANLCLLVRQPRLAALGGWEPLLADIRRACPALDARLTGAEPCWPKPLAVSGLPYGHQWKGEPDGLWRLGDQAAVIPSFAGEGMSIALHSAFLAALGYLAGEEPEVAQRQLMAVAGRSLAIATFVSKGLTHPAGQALAGKLVGAAPWTMRGLAAATRLRVR